MPYIVTDKVCSKCKGANKLFRFRWHKQNNKHLFVSRCKDCEHAATKEHQQKHREYWRNLNRKSYTNWTPEFKAKRLLESHNRHHRLRRVYWEQELTEFVTEEAHNLRALRNKLTNIKWHVDHIIPLNGREVSGLHVWNNLQVIPATENLVKRNHFVVGG